MMATAEGHQSGGMAGDDRVTAAAMTTATPMTTMTTSFGERDRTMHQWTMVRGKESGGQEG